MRQFVVLMKAKHKISKLLFCHSFIATTIRLHVLANFVELVSVVLVSVALSVQCWLKVTHRQHQLQHLISFQMSVSNLKLLAGVSELARQFLIVILG